MTDPRVKILTLADESNGLAKRSGTWIFKTGNLDRGALANFLIPPKDADAVPTDGYWNSGVS
jgi:hypothetical protein